MNSDVSTREVQEDAVRWLNRIGPLTYQQKQLVNGGAVAPVFAQIARKRRRLTLVIAAVGFLCTYYSLRAVVSGTSVWGSTILAAIFFSWLFARIAKLKAVRLSIERYTAAVPVPDTPVDQLEADLRLNHSLTYTENQQLASGGAVPVAREVAARRRNNGKSMILGVWPLCACFIVIDLYTPRDLDTPDRMLLQDYLAGIVTCAILIACAFVYGLREKRLASILEQKIIESQTRKTQVELGEG